MRPTGHIPRVCLEHAWLPGFAQVFVDGARMQYGFLHGFFGHFMICDALYLLFGVEPPSFVSQQFLQMPSDSFSFTVRVGCDEDFVCLGRFAANLVYDDDFFGTIS